MFRTLASSLGSVPTKLGCYNQNVRRRCNEIECEKLKKYLCMKFIIQSGLCKVVNKRPQKFLRKPFCLAYVAWYLPCALHKKNYPLSSHLCGELRCSCSTHGSVIAISFFSVITKIAVVELEDSASPVPSKSLDTIPSRLITLPYPNMSPKVTVK